MAKRSRLLGRADGICHLARRCRPTKRLTAQTHPGRVKMGLPHELVGALEPRMLLTGVSFVAARAFDVGDQPSAVVVADFNGDGKKDLATTNGDSVSVLLGKGDGIFQAKQDFAVAGEAGGSQTLATGDFNGDGKSDLMTMDSHTGSVTVLLGNEDGTLQSRHDLALEGQHDVVVKVGDFNGDGKSDLLAACGVHKSASVLLSDGDGTFQVTPSFDLVIDAMGSSFDTVVVGDFNGDGKSDLVTADYWVDGVDVLLSKGDGTFEAKRISSVGDWPDSMTVGDFNRDGKSDLATVGSSGDLTVLVGKGDGTFRAMRAFSPGRAVAFTTVADWNGDGNADLVIAGYDSGGLSVLLGKGDGTFQAQRRLHVGGYGTPTALADFNEDGKDDLALANVEYATVTIFLGCSDGTFPAKRDLSVGMASAVAVGDFNGDGKSDLAAAGGSSDVRVLLGTGDGTFRSRGDFRVGTSPCALVVGDFNGDGKSDLVTASNNGGGVSLLLGKADGTFRAKRDFGVGSSRGSLAVGDFNGDGRSDLATADYDSQTVSVFLGKADGTFRAERTFDIEGGPTSVTVGDFNRDGRSDLLTTIASCWGNPGKVSVLLGNGDGLFHVVQDLGAIPRAAAVGDFNRDGKSDLVVADAFAGGTSVLLGNGDGTFQPQQKVAAGRYPDGVALGDFNQDGKIDLVTCGNDVSVLAGNGDGTFQAKQDFNTGDYTRWVVVGDFNRDGKVDLVAANNMRVNRVSVLLNSILTASVAENRPAGTLVGLLPIIEAEDDPLTYSLTDETGAPLAGDNVGFKIEGDQFLSNAKFNYEKRRTYRIVVRATDEAGLFQDDTITLHVTDVNERPKAVEVALNLRYSASGLVVGTLSTIDPDAGNGFGYALVDGKGARDNAAFTIVGNQIKLTSLLQYQTKRAYTIRVRSTDHGGLSRDRVITIDLAQLSGQPVGSNLSWSQVGSLWRTGLWPKAACNTGQFWFV